MHPSPFAPFLDRVHLGPRQTRKALTLWPLLRSPGAASFAGPEFCGLSDALEDGFVGVEAAAGRVRIENRAGIAVLVLAGEELHGRDKSCFAAASVLVPAQSELAIDAACAEPARRRPDAPRPLAADPRVLARVADAFRPLDRQVGFVAAVGGRVVGFEAVGRSGIFGCVFERLLQPYAGLALGAASASGFEAPEAFLTALRAAPVIGRAACRGVGDDLRVGCRRVAGRALAVGDELIHGSAASCR